ncbi:hypothetical protein [Sinomicrobium weinanense]|uniref:Uncharacterized protein n=1 Tax=Sinomicrobium weinanense TaxID=2842200 RepID=A0A926JU64_9FLAO|nr:hypothetical protein [Sinomicrobium weinanense]MBC9797593.1 hypothetical protein [Sinomicrobium weinanense]MBU3123660.1 hypothetical protein [Sinomicrobium weinanense]
MFNEFSWGEYALMIILVLTAYYAALGLWFYILKLRTPVSGIQLATHTAQRGNYIKETVSPASFEETPNETFEQTEAIMTTLKDVIAEAFNKKYNRKQLLNSLGRTLQKHPEIVGTPFQQGIQEFIKQECYKHAPVGLRDREMKLLWGTKT